MGGACARRCAERGNFREENGLYEEEDAVVDVERTGRDFWITGCWIHGTLGKHFYFSLTNELMKEG